MNFVAPGFFEVAGLGIRDGRGFAERDRAGARRVAVVNTEFARRAWPGRSAIGGRLFVGDETTGGATVVGVVETPLEYGLQGDPVPQYYLPIAQAASVATSSRMASRMASSSRALVVRTRGNPGRVVPAVLLALADLFPDLPGSSVQSMPAAFAELIRSWRIGTALFARRRPAGPAARGRRALRGDRLRRAPARAGVRHPARPRRPVVAAPASGHGALRRPGGSGGSRPARSARSGPAGSSRRCCSTGAARAIRWPSRPPPWCCWRWPWSPRSSPRAAPPWRIPVRLCRRSSRSRPRYLFELPRDLADAASTRWTTVLRRALEMVDSRAPRPSLHPRSRGATEQPVGVRGDII